jgi:DNA-binding transcriptional LysR family regulator
VELRHLRYFIAVAEELSFRSAANRLHISQPPLSVQIRQLEKELGTDLFVRTGRNIRLTQAGRVFLEHARQSLTHVNRSVVLAREAAHGDVGHLSIGCGTAAEFRVFPTLIPAFKKKWPKVRLTFHNLRTPGQIEKLQRGELDVAFAWLPVSSGEFETHALLEEPFVAILCAKHPLANIARISIKDLSKEPLVMFPQSLDPELFHRVEQLFLEAGAVINVAYELESLVSVLNFVAMGIGCSILPDYIRMLPRKGVIYKSLRSPNLIKTLGIIKKRGAGGLAESFFSFAAEQARLFQGSGRRNGYRISHAPKCKVGAPIRKTARTHRC